MRPGVSVVSLAGCCLLALVTLTLTLLVEYRNWKADHYLPRGGSDAPWRMEAGLDGAAGHDKERSELRDTVISFGLPLYLLCPLTILWAAFSSAQSFSVHRATLPVSMTCLAIGIMSTILVTSLHVLESLG